MADFSIRPASPDVLSALERTVDREGRIPAALEELGPVSGRSVLVVAPPGGVRARQLGALGASVIASEDAAEVMSLASRAEVVVAPWVVGLAPGGPGRGASASPDGCDGPGWVLAVLGPRLAPGGRLLLVEDYGRDDVSALAADADRERRIVEQSRPRGPLLGAGFRVRVLHCWWTWDSREEAAAFLWGAFGEAGRRVAEGLGRPRLAYKVAVYHRTAGHAADAGASVSVANPTGALVA